MFLSYRSDLFCSTDGKSFAMLAEGGGGGGVFNVSSLDVYKRPISVRLKQSASTLFAGIGDVFHSVQWKEERESKDCCNRRDEYTAMPSSATIIDSLWCSNNSI